MSTETPQSAEVASAAGTAADRRRPQNEWASERHVYEPHFVGLPPIGQYLREVWRRREFCFELSRTELRAEHFDTVFGIVWMVLNPMLLAAVYFVLVDVIRHGHHPPGFFAHLVAGIFAYYMISGAVRSSVKSVTNGGSLILNSSFPRMLLPLTEVVTAFKRFVPTAVIYVPVHLLSGLPVHWSLLWVFPLVFLMVLMAIGFAHLVATIQVYFRDMASFLPYMLRMWLYISPVLYFPSDVPHGWTWLLDVNPLGQLFTAWTDVLYYGHAPGWHTIAIACAWTFGALLVGSLVFMSREREFAVRL
jgi:ABC-type polysaccharide/polyol phosphate export permease